MNEYRGLSFVALIVLCSSASAAINFYEHDNFRGRVFYASGTVSNFSDIGFNDKASSAVVDRGLWEVCDDADFRGRCVVLRRGNYESLGRLGLNDKISSVRPVSHSRDYDAYPEPSTLPAYEYRRRPNEELTEVRITSARAMYGPPNERCWTEHEYPSESSQSKPNLGGALLGAVIGGVIGHQVGGGRGQSAATAAGAVAGAAVGSGAGRGSDQGREVERCRRSDRGRPSYWEVTYDFRGREYSAQLSYPPGRTILVNRDGEPRN